MRKKMYLNLYFIDADRKKKNYQCLSYRVWSCQELTFLFSPQTFQIDSWAKFTYKQFTLSWHHIDVLYLFTVVDDDDKQKLEMRTVCECVEIHFHAKRWSKCHPRPKWNVRPARRRRCTTSRLASLEGAITRAFSG